LSAAVRPEGLLAQKDARELEHFGYAQELLRGMGGFSNFAISFSIISILTGAVTLFDYGLTMGGPLEMTLGWPLATAGTLSASSTVHPHKGAWTVFDCAWSLAESPM